MRRLLYSSGAIALVGVLIALAALERINSATTRADAALQLGTPVSSPGAVMTPDDVPAMVAFEHASADSRRATLVLGLSAMLTPLLVFLNVLGFAGQHAAGPTVRRFDRDDERRALRVMKAEAS